jgi:hypothetical protein
VKNGGIKILPFFIVTIINKFMALNVELGIGCSGSSSSCNDAYGCPQGIQPDFCIKRHDTQPSYKVSIDDCDGVIDLTDESLVLEASIWCNAKLKKNINDQIDYISFADNIGFNQVMQNDIVIMDRARGPEYMLVTGFDENNKLIRVQRGYNGTQIQSWSKGSSLRIFRAINAPAEIQSVFEDITQEDGTISNQLTSTFLVFNWDSATTCLPGCYWLEFKLMKMQPISFAPIVKSDISNISFIPYEPEDLGCGLGVDVEWVRRFPSQGEGFLIKINDTPTNNL